jgi:hypothetical protein
MSVLYLSLVPDDVYRFLRRMRREICCCSTGPRMRSQFATLKPDTGDLASPNATRQRRALHGIDASSPRDVQFPKSFGTYLRHLTRADKVAFLWPSTELHGCRATALETM